MQLATEELRTLIKKYGVILIVFFVFRQLLLTGLTELVIDYIYPDTTGSMSFRSAFSFVSALISIAVNAIIAFIGLSDTRKVEFRWLIFFLTLLAPAIGVLFLLLMRLLEKDTTE